jgi:hypothetical protein
MQSTRVTTKEKKKPPAIFLNSEASQDKWMDGWID